MTRNEPRSTGSKYFLVFCSNHYFSFLFFLLFSLGNSLLWAGSLDSPAAVTDSNSAMHDLESIYNRLDTGATGSKRTTTFGEPSSGPGATGRTLDEVMGKTPVVDAANGALMNEVQFGKTFWGLRSGEWGPHTGTDRPVMFFSTGQNKCYDSAGVIIPCAGTGQDADLQNGTHHASPRFTDNADGTVTDNSTGLIWLKKLNCLGYISFEAALTESNNLASGTGSGLTCGLSDGSSAGDWRLANVVEMLSLIDPLTKDPALPVGHPFDLIPFLSVVKSQVNWTSTSRVNHPKDAMVVDITEGTSLFSPKVITKQAGAWAIRGGQ